MVPARMMRESGSPAITHGTASPKATANQMTRLIAPRIIWARSRASAIVLTDRVKTVDGDGVGDAGGTVDHSTGYRVAVARAELALLFADAEQHAARDNVANLLMRVSVGRHGRILGDAELHDHDVV